MIIFFMHKTAGNFTYEQQIKFDIEHLNFVENLNPTGSYTYYFYGETYAKTSVDFLKEIQSYTKIRPINYDVSISSEDEIEIYTEKHIDWIYTIISIEWSAENFETVLDKFGDSSPHIVSIRETNNSKIFWNRVIKVDIVN